MFREDSMGKPCCVLRQHFFERENLAAFCGNTFTSGKTSLRSAATLLQAGKPCRAPREHFPRREKLAALRRNIFPGGKSLPRCAATLLQAGKPCCVLRQHFYGHGNLAAFCGRLSTIIYSLPSFPVRSHQGVCDTPLHFWAKNLY